MDTDCPATESDFKCIHASHIYHFASFLDGVRIVARPILLRHQSFCRAVDRVAMPRHGNCLLRGLTGHRDCLARHTCGFPDPTILPGGSRHVRISRCRTINIMDARPAQQR